MMAAEKTTESRTSFSSMIASLLFALTTALITGVLLLVNGGVVLVVMKSLSNVGPDWIHRPGFQQFILFSFPLAMVVIEWSAWDVLRGLFGRAAE